MTAQKSHGLSKAERISGVKDVAALLAGGKWMRSELLKVCFMRNDLEYSRIVVAVPKRLFKRAVKRNLLKRRIREAYRLQKELLGATPGAAATGFDILLQYNSPEVADFAAIRDDVAVVLRRIVG
jgi:ribonuclease P protein component